MNYEVKDYREPQKPKLGSWPFWTVPEFYALSYLIRIGIFLLGIPWLFGMALTAKGLFITFLLLDYFTYVGLKKVYGLE